MAKRRTRLTRSRFYLDTNVYRHITEGDEKTKEFVVNNLARMRLASITALELIEDIWTCEEEATFLLRKRALELARLVGGRGKRILPSDDEFIRKVILPFRGHEVTKTAAVANRWLDTVVRYRSRAELSKLVPYSVGQVSFDFADLSNRIWKQRKAYVEMLDTYKMRILTAAGLTRAGLRDVVSGDGADAVNAYFKSDLWKVTYVNLYAKVLRMGMLDQQTAMKVYAKLKIPCEFSTTILRQSLCDGYRYDKNANDCLDEAHLRYLCDDSLCFVTDDEKLRRKISASSRARVIRSSELPCALHA